MKRLLIVLILLPASLLQASAVTFNIRDYGAVGDGKALDTEAINQAIDACALAGGGKVLVPEGNYLSATVRLKSHVTLELEANATIIGTTNLDLYHSFLDGKPRNLLASLSLPANPRWHRALLLLDNVKDVAITGAGTIDGVSLEDPQGEERRRGPHCILIGQSTNVSISNIRIARGGNYNLLASQVDKAVFRNLTIIEGYDGIHIRGGTNLIIENCKIYSRDDAIAGGYWDKTVIAGCLLNSSCNGVRLIMPATNLEIKDCDIFGPGVFGHHRGRPVNPFITGTLAAIIIQPGAWGTAPGVLDNLSVHDLRIRDLNTAFMFNLNRGNTCGSITVERVQATGIHSTACSVEAWPEGSRFNQVRFKDVSIEFDGRADPALKNIPLTAPRGTESRMLPCWGMYVRNVGSFAFENVSLSYTGAEVRPVMIMENVDNAVFSNFKHQNVPDIEQINYTNVTHVTY